MKNFPLKIASFSLLFCLLLFSTISYGQPIITSFTPERGPVGTLVTIKGTNLGTPNSFIIGGVSAIVVSNNGNTLVGMVMPGASTGVIRVVTPNGSVTSSTSFLVTVAQPPTKQQASKLVGSGATGAAQQGWCVSLSADGNTALVGGSNDNSGIGAAWVYTRSDSVWTQQGNKLVGTGAVGASTQGKSVSISADGNTAIVGGFNDNATAGAAWIYTRSGGVWSQQGGKLVGSGAINSQTGAEQGYAVSISADGNTAVVGAPYDNYYMGAAWVYTRSDGVWTQQGDKLAGTGATGNDQPEQGTCVSLSADGNTFIMGGSNDNGARGAAWVYSRSGGVWTQQGGKLVGADAIGAASQGFSVCLSADGNTAIVGGLFDNSSEGAAWVYSRSGGVWSQQGNKLVGTGVEGNAIQGISVSLSADGNTAIVGGMFDNSSAGAAWVYTRSGGVWTQLGNKLVGTGRTGPAFQGRSVSLSADGTTAMIGGNQDNSFAGAAWVFRSPQPPIINSFTPSSGPVGTLVTINGTDLNSPTALKIGGTSAIIVSDNSATIVGMVMPGTVTGTISITTAAGSITSNSNFTVTTTKPPSAQQGPKLVGTGATGAAKQGYCVSLSADGNTAIVGGHTDNADTGAVWVYTRVANVWTQQGNKLVGSGSIGTSNQGSSVSLSADGNTAIVGGDADNYGQGAVWVFTRSGNVWTQQGDKLVGTGSTGAVGILQGCSVSLSADGNTAVVGGAYDNLTAGAAWIFTRSNGVWTQQGGKLVGTGATDEARQGNSVSISADGNTVMVGGSEDDNYAGAAWIYIRSAGVWTQQGNKLVGTGATDDAQQGYSVCLSADGNTAIMGGSVDNDGVGATWVFVRSGGLWSQQGGKLVGAGAIDNAEQGSSVSLSADGNIALIGGSENNLTEAVAWVYTRSQGVWTQHGGKLVGTGAAGVSEEGVSVSLSADGSTGLVGAPGNDADKGAAWVYVYIPQTSATGLNFDGIDDRVQMPSPLVGNLTNFTAETWLKWDGLNNGILYAEGKNGSTNPVFSFGPTKKSTNGALEIILKNTGGVGLDKQLTKGIIPVNVWTHVAFVRNSATTAILYINGNPTDSMNFTDPGTIKFDVANMGVRQSVGLDEFFGGSMDEFRLWNRALCQGEIQNNMNAGINATAQSGLIAAYHLDNGFVDANNTGLTTASDATGNGNNGTLINFALAGTKSNWVAGTVTGTAPTYIPSSLFDASAGNAGSKTEVINAAGTYYIDNSCGLIAKVLPSGNVPASGSINVKVTFDNSVQVYNNSPYVQRHYDIEPAKNATNATATVTLYFMQTDFDAYNAIRRGLPALPKDPSDAAGIGNLRITQFHGSGIAPGNYTGSGVLIDPNDANIVWNAVNSRWEVTFEVNGFSGFYVHTTLGSGALPVTLINFSGTNSGSINNLKWTTTVEQNSAFFDLERSIDGSNFIKIAIIPSQRKGSSNTSYNYNDNITGFNSSVYFYRLKMVDIDGYFAYSTTIKINTLPSAFSMEVSPNPFNSNLQVNIISPITQQATISFSDINGRLLFKTKNLIQKGSNVLLLPQADNLPKGMYLLKLQTDTQQQNNKVIKK